MREHAEQEMLLSIGRYHLPPPVTSVLSFLLIILVLRFLRN